jgi:hypothetical protein
MAWGAGYNALGGAILEALHEKSLQVAQHKDENERMDRRGDKARLSGKEDALGAWRQS